MFNVSKVLLLLIIIAFFVGYDMLYLSAFDDVRIFNVVAEFSFAFMAAVLFLLIDSLKGKTFYHFLNLGFLLVFISMLVDGLDQFHYHNEFYTALAEKTTLLIGFVFLFYGMNSWIVEYGRLNKKLETQAFTDELTGLYNRRGMMMMFESLNKQAVQDNRDLSFIIADLDDFKKYNDTLGHVAGDQFLACMGHSLLSMMSNNEVIGRWGGEEFAVGMLGRDIEQALEFAEQIRLNVTNLDLPATMHIKSVTISLGVSQKAPDEPLMEAIKRADRSLYAAKNKGKNQSFVYF